MPLFYSVYYNFFKCCSSEWDVHWSLQKKTIVFSYFYRSCQGHKIFQFMYLTLGKFSVSICKDNMNFIVLCIMYMYLHNLQYPFYINNAKRCLSWRYVCISSVWFISYYTFENCMGRVVWNIMATNFMLHKRFCEKLSGILGLFTYYVKILYLCDGLS